MIFVNNKMLSPPIYYTLTELLFDLRANDLIDITADSIRFYFDIAISEIKYSTIRIKLSRVSHVYTREPKGVYHINYKDICGAVNINIYVNMIEFMKCKALYPTFGEDIYSIEVGCNDDWTFCPDTKTFTENMKVERYNYGEGNENLLLMLRDNVDKAIDKYYKEVSEKLKKKKPDDEPETAH